MPGKVDPIEMERLIQKGKKNVEIARHFGVSPAAITLARKALKKDVVKNVALENAHRIVGQQIDAMAQLNNAVQKVNALIERFDGREDKDGADIYLKALAESRKQISTLMEIAKTMMDYEAVQEFQAAVLETIASVDDSLKQQILKKLRQSKAIRAAVTIN
jgi:hypothetical protein